MYYIETTTSMLITLDRLFYRTNSREYVAITTEDRGALTINCKDNVALVQQRGSIVFSYLRTCFGTTYKSIRTYCQTPQKDETCSK